MKLPIVIAAVLSITMLANFCNAQEQDTMLGKNYPAYPGKDLGLTYSKKKSVFKIWSPRASKVLFHLYEEGSGGEPKKTQEMKKGNSGDWSLTLKGDQEGKFYTFQVGHADSLLHETPDPYAKATGVNGKRAMVVDLAKTSPPGWNEEKRPALKSVADIVLYELHLRDLSTHESSGIKNKGKYLGLTEKGTKTPGGQSTGLDHIKDLGVTHIHLLPVYDYMSVDESNPGESQYNWGYDPQNYNVPEGSYSSDPHDGRVRIREFKQMVKTLHENGLRVVMDVVYNHTGGETEMSVFNRMVPNYYYRKTLERDKWSNASGCGNETASERPMMRKFMLESMLYWVKEYHIDGFRVDLMGIHDFETMNLIADELRKIDPNIIIYGEGWTAGSSTLSEQLRAVKSNVPKLHGIAAFSDEFRDGIKGNVFKPEAKGFASGETGLEESVKFGIVGGVAHPQVNNKMVNYSKHPWALQPTQCINYVSCHDNHTLYDRLKNSCKGEPESELLKLNMLCQAIVLTSQGIPFLHAGEEILRSKNGVENSFESPDEINQIRWSNKETYGDLFQFYKGMVQLRKAHPAFRMGNADLVAKHLKFIEIPHDNIIAYLLNDHANGDSWNRILVIFNGNKVGKSIAIPEGKWKIISQEGRVNEQGMGTVSDNRVNLHGRSAMILAE